MKKAIAVLAFFVCLAGFGVAQAHQPRLVWSQDVIEISNPEVSQAFYAELKEKPQFFRIVTYEELPLYVSLLVPDIEGADKDFNVRIYRTRVPLAELANLDSRQYDWTRFYEKYAGDWYWQGPEFRQTVPLGVYEIEVSSPDNLGKYVLAMGEKEEFLIKEALKTIVVIPELKSDFFGKSVFSSFFNYIGLLISLATLLILAAAAGLVWLVRKIIRRGAQKS